MSDIVRVGIAGLGTATRLMLHALMRNPLVEIVAAASVREEERLAFTRDFSIPTYADIEEMCGLEGVDAIYVSTPTHLHVAHVLMALQHGKHVLVEKPLATSLESARTIVHAAKQYDRVVVVGHSHSYDPPIQAIRSVVQSGRIGNLKMIHNWCYTDWMYRPRLQDELNTALGGGVTFRQGAHQFDIIRFIGGGKLRSVRSATGVWDGGRPTEGSHVVFLEFENGAAATAVYNGYDHFHSSELTFGIGEWGNELSHDEASYGSRRRMIGELREGEEQDIKRQQSAYRSLTSLPDLGEHQPFFGMTLVSCERGDIRQIPDGIRVYSEDSVEDIALPSGVTPHDNVIAEFCDAVLGRQAPVHTAAWGLATLEVCFAVLESAAKRQEVYLNCQTSL
ncbi:Gfo/Idh/MocA family protein [Alicyclobacillus dauci]|uniref:Gfo/Idh/MocA family oxidoreductase n=1 Tax=Alicyclobacillus dauci TaxID=1475485 RepID=A0ABY6YYI8_9BACL|nr:Gfo/Idh/MocA family oxidoreductase [Alicyclobacillus dauci]WAH35641.1 Gfo/Idh/MocA family oxidoreductase [Alicyclobacillus dauci]